MLHADKDSSAQCARAFNPVQMIKEAQGRMLTKLVGKVHETTPTPIQ